MIRSGFCERCAGKGRDQGQCEGEEFHGEGEGSTKVDKNTQDSEIPKLPPKIAPEDTQKAEKTLGFIWFYESGCGGGGSGFTRPVL